MGSVTRLLSRVRAGDTDAHSALFAQVYTELMRIAHARLADNRVRSLDAPGLVHEANVVVDLVRHQRAQKRGAGAPEVTLSAADEQIEGGAQDVEELHSAMQRLEQIDQRAYRVTEMRYFAGLSIEEIAQVLEVSEATVQRSWRSARAFLFEALR
jgi:RNA polymerase sigma factor (sigma-70 family)